MTRCGLPDLAGRRAGDLGGVVSVDPIQVREDLFLVRARVVELLPGLHLSGEDAAGAQAPDEVVHRVAEGEQRGRLVGARRPHHFFSVRVLALDLPPRGGIGQVAHDRARQVAHAHPGARRAGQHRKEPPPQHRVSERLLDLILPGLLSVQVLLQQHVVGLRHRLHQPGAQLLRVADELLGDLLLDVPAELAVLPTSVGVRAHGDEVDDAAEGVAQPDGQLQRDRPGLQGLLDVVQGAQEAGPVLVELVHARDER